MLAKRFGFYPTFPNLFSDFFDKEFSEWTSSNFSQTQTTLTAVNIKDTADGFEVVMAAPGMDKGDFKINLDNNVLTISSEKKSENEQKDDKYSRKEYSYQSFMRSFTLPKDVADTSKIKARYENGELFVTIPKREEAKVLPPRTIEIE